MRNSTLTKLLGTALLTSIGATASDVASLRFQNPGSKACTGSAG